MPNSIETSTETCPMFNDCLVDNRDELATYLNNCGIGTRNMYPPVHSQKIYEGDDKDFPSACLLGKKGFWLPSSLKINDSDIDFICDKIIKFFKS